MTNDTKAIVAAILTTARLIQLGTEGGRSTRTAYVDEFREMLHALNHGEDKKAHATHDPL